MLLDRIFRAPKTNERRGSKPKAAPAMMDTLESRTLMSIVSPGGFVLVHGTKVAVRPELAGTVIHDTLIPITITSSGGTVIFKGHLQDRVVRETKAGTLDFYQDIRADAGFKASAFLEDVERTNFKAFSTDVDYRTDGIGTPSIHPIVVTRNNTGGPLVSFFFGGEVVKEGNGSLFYFVKTNAKKFTINGTTSIEMEALTATGAPGDVGTVNVVTARPTT